MTNPFLETERRPNPFLEVTQDFEFDSFDLQFVNMEQYRPTILNLSDMPGGGRYVTSLEAARVVFGTWAAPSVWATQITAAMERNLQGLRGDRERQLYLPEFSTLEQAIIGEYPNPEDPGLAVSNMMSWAGLNPAWQIERQVRGPETEENQFYSTGRAILPDTPEDAAETLRGVAVGVRAAEEVSWMTQFGVAPPISATPLIPTLGAAAFNEQFLAEATHDPLIIVDFYLGAKIAGGLRFANRSARGVSPTYDAIAHSLDRSFISPVAEGFNRATGKIHRDVYRFARPFMSEANYELSQAARQADMIERNIREGVGGPWLSDFYGEEIAPRITNLTERAPADVQEIMTRYGAGERVTVTEFEVAQEMLEDYSRIAFPDIPDVAQRGIADRIGLSLEMSGRLPEIERLMDIPTAHLMSDNAYMEHLFTSGARRSRLSSIPDWRQRWSTPNYNIIGQELTSTLQKRTLRGTVQDYNSMAAAGRVGFMDGRLKILGADDVAPEGFQAVTKLFNDDPRILALARQSRSVQARSASGFMRAIGDNPTFLGSGPTLEGLVTKGEWERTFGRLGENLQDIARTTQWKDLDTAEAILHYSRFMQDITDRPAPLLRMFDRAFGVLKGMTLTPFMPYHVRNHVGGFMNHLLSGGTVFDWIDAAFPSRFRDWSREFERAGLPRMGQVRRAWAASEDSLYLDIFEGTPLRSGWRNQIRRLTNITAEDFYGKTVAEAIENHQRRATFFGARRRGRSFEDATNMAYTYHFDYADVPPWMQLGRPEPLSFRRLTFFPIWTLKNLPVQLQHLFTTPAQFAMRGRYMNLSEQAALAQWQDMPEFVREGAGFAMPSMDPDQPLFFRPENFDPAMTLSEVVDDSMMFPGVKFAWEMLAPFVTEPIEQGLYTAKVDARGGPTVAVPTLPTTPVAERTGFDVFFERPIYRPWVEWNPALEHVGLRGKMPEFWQRADHAARGFLRFYTETSSMIREGQRMAAGESAYDPAEFGARRWFGVPIFAANRDQTLYYALKKNDQELDRLWGNARDDMFNGRSTNPETLDGLKTYYLQRIAQLSHGTYMEVNPWDGTPRPWEDIPRDGDFSIQGRKDLWRDLLKTYYLLFYGRVSHDANSTPKHDPIPLDPSEMAFLTELFTSNIEAYVVVMQALAEMETDVNLTEETNYAYSFLEEPEEQ